MAEDAAQYLLASPGDIQSLADKLTEFTEGLSPIEQSLFMERIKRSMPAVEVNTAITLVGSPEIFGAWLNAVVPGGSRWFPSQVKR